MSNMSSNGHSDALTEPNSQISVPAPVLKKTKKPVQPKEEKDEDLLSFVQEDTMAETTFEEEAIIDKFDPGTMESAPVPIAKNKVYGRYRGTLGTFELELRIDYDGYKPLQKVSGDFFTISGLTKTYFGSFVANSIITSNVAGVITITGTITATWVTLFTKFKISITQTSVFSPLAPALLQWYHESTGAPGTMYTCNYFSRAFRTVRLEQDSTAGVTPFVSYNTGSLPSGGPTRVLSVNTAYNEAGVEMLNAGVTNVVPMVIAGADAKWSNAELHTAMVNHFSIFAEKPMWDVWLLHAYEHELGAGLYGIMFDQTGLQRQGCAVFYKGIGGATNEQKRLQLYTTVHELGHCFNLLHSWQKSLASPPKPNIPNSFSWMNYPWGFPAGPAAYWNGFPFQFDPVEVAHIRHGYRSNVIMGGNPFATGSSLEDTARIFEDNIESNANLELELEAKQSYLLGEPVLLETKLKTTSTKNKKVISSIHANFGFITIGIKKPGGALIVYEPIAEMCMAPESVILNGITNPGVYQSSYIGFGKDGFIFDNPGIYQIRAVYYDEDGSRIVSNTLSLRVKSPFNAKDDEIAELLLNEEVGYLFAFMGSDAPYLQKGNDALDLVTEKHSDHPLAVYAQFVKGVNAQRTFKTISQDKNIAVRPPDFTQGEQLLSEVIKKSKARNGLDNISLNQTMQILAKAYQREGNTQAAEATVNNITAHFNSLPIKQSVKENIRKEADNVLKNDIENK